MNLTHEEIELLRKVLLNEIKNGNTVNPKPFDSTPQQYKMFFGIMKKLDKIEQAAG